MLRLLPDLMLSSDHQIRLAKYDSYSQEYSSCI
jgi:hypothetical protein